MNHSRSILRGAVMALALSTACVAAARGPDVREQTQNGIAYVTGGIGTEQQDLMHELGRQGYTLKLVFAEQGTGAYVADVHVTISDRSGRTLLDTDADGPAFFARLPAGEYRVSAEYKGMRQTRIVRAGGGTPTTLYWAQEDGSAAMPASTRAPHGDGAALTGGHAGEAAERAR